MSPSPRHAENVPRPGHGTPDRDCLGSGFATFSCLCTPYFGLGCCAASIHFLVGQLNRSNAHHNGN